MSSEPRRPYDIDTLTDVALRVFAERGYDGASMDDVARAAGITKASIYHHVSGKEALLERGLTRALDALFAILREPGALEGRALARLQYIVSRVAEVTLRLLPELTVLFRARGTAKSERDALERRREFDRIVTDLVRGAQRDGDLRADLDPRLAVRLVFGMSNSVVEWYRPGGVLEPATVTATVVLMVFEGLGVRGR
ncbi:MAG TPA: TetR/AcrR family transcriptional regulator [Candidatus Sulfotelmatobacter sp.]|nr:TetR/AcrR family transcriptional regulator [Candidatus Sulfotelmatobacter sp.]